MYDLTVFDQNGELTELIQASQEAQDQLAELNRHYDHIAAQGGISRSQAEALVQECGLSLEAHMPLVSFTSIPSLTNYAPTLESLERMALDAVITLIKKAAELLVKLVRWAINALRERYSQRQRVANGAHNASVLGRATKKLASILANTPTREDSQSQAAQKNMDEIVSNFQSNFNDLEADLLKNGPVSMALRRMSVSVMHSLIIVDKKLKLFETLLTGHDRDVHSNIGQLKTIAEPIPVEGYGKIMADMDMQVHEGALLYNVFEGLFNKLQEMREAHMFEPPPLAELSSLIGDGRSDFTNPVVLAPKPIIDALEGVEQRLKRIMNVHPLPDADQNLQNAYRDAQNQLVSEITAVRYFVQCVALMESCQNDLLSQVLVYEAQMVRMAQLRATGATPEVVREVNQVQAEIKSGIKH